MTTKTPHVHAGNSASTRLPHSHAELIKAWADGATIQFFNKTLQQWRDCSWDFYWNPCIQYRVKPEPKPDVVMYAMIQLTGSKKMAKIQSVNANEKQIPTDTCMFVFDGETGELKDAQVLTKE